jgi:hypothetical protein
VAFAGSLALFTNARRQDVFAATAAYAAVLVVFISGNLGSGTLSSPSSVSDGLPTTTATATITNTVWQSLSTVSLSTISVSTISVSTISVSTISVSTIIPESTALTATVLSPSPTATGAATSVGLSRNDQLATGLGAGFGTIAVLVTIAFFCLRRRKKRLT